MVQPWRVVRSRTTFADKWLRVRSDDCIDGAGRSIAPYHVLDYPEWVHVAPITRAGEIVMIRQYRHAAGVVAVETVAGSVDPDDANPAAAARRELAEETGYAAREVVVLGRTYANPASHTNSVTHCVALGAHPAGLPARELGEDMDVDVRDLPALLRAVDAGELVIPALAVATLHFAERYLLRTTDPDLSGLRRRLRVDCRGSA